MGVFLLLTTTIVQAQTPTVTGLSPARNARSAPRTTNVDASFSQALSNTPATQQALKIFSAQVGGKKAGTATVSGNTLSFNPSTAFKAGETVFGTVTSAAQSSSGTAAAPHAFQFTTATAPGPTTFAGPEVRVGSSPVGVALGDIDSDGDLDLVTADFNFTGSVSVRLNNGNGSFVNGQSPTVGAVPYRVVLGDVDSDGDLDILVSYYNTAAVSVRLNNGSGTFAGGQEVGVGNNPQGLAVGDVDNDGDLDLLTSNSTASGTVSVRLNNGSGTFSGTQEVSVGTTPRNIAVGDVDNDGDLDFLTANDAGFGVGPSTVSVRLNNGNGIFTGTTEVAISEKLYDLKLGDLDGDGDLDLVTASFFNVSVRLNDGTGVFSGTQNMSSISYSVALGDVDGDGDLDILAASDNYNFGLVMRLNNGFGTFGDALIVPVPVGTSSYGVAMGDLDADNDLDLVATNRNSFTVSVRLNQGLPTLTSVSPSRGPAGSSITLTGTNLLGTTTVSFNGALIYSNEFVVNSPTQITAPVPANATTGPITVTTPVGTSNSISFTVTLSGIVASVAPARNASTVPQRTPVAVTFAQPLSNTPATQQALRVFSQQAGGKKAGTATVIGNTLTFIPNSPFKAGETVFATVSAATPQVFQFTTAVTPSTGRFGGGSDIPLGGVLTDAVTGDVDGDGDLDAVVSSRTGATLRLNNGNGTFSGGKDIPLSATVDVARLALGDLDNDGDLDLLLGSLYSASSGGKILVLLNDGSSTFSTGQTINGNGSKLALGDVDADGDLDFIGAEGTVYLNNSMATFSLGQGGATGGSDVALGDIDNDGDLDVLATFKATAATVLVSLNNGDGTFTYRSGGNVPVGASPESIALGDVDKDGDLDFVTGSSRTNSNAGSVSIRLNNGAGFFSGTQTLPINDVFSVALRDVDGDGDLDLVAVNDEGANVSIRFNDGAGSFSGTEEVGVSPGSRGLALGDLDNDGDLDLLTSAANEGNGVVSVRLNQSTDLLPTAFSPRRNAYSAPLDTDVAVTFNQALTNTAATQGALKVFSQQSGGRKAGTATVSGNTLSFNPTTDFKPGETVFATLTNEVQSNGGGLPTSKVFQFTTAVGSSPGTFFGGSDQVGNGSLAVGDVNGDGSPDYVTTQGLVFLNDGTGLYRQNQQLSVNSPNAGSLALGDIDSDGDLDVLEAFSYNGGVVVFLNNGQGTFGLPQQYITIGSQLPGLVVGDIDGDGDLDFMAANASQQTVNVQLNNGRGQFFAGQTVSLAAQPSKLATGDLDGDGDLDLVVTHPGTASVSVRFNNGSGLFSGSQSVAVGFSPNGIVLGDIDADGDLDLLTANFNDSADGSQSLKGDVSVRLNNGSGVFSGTQQVAINGHPINLALGDTDGDGDLDLVTANGLYYYGNTTSVRLNDGTGSFAGTQEVLVSTGPSNVVLADVDSDGDLDMLTGGVASASVRLNQPITAPIAVTSLAPTPNTVAVPRTTPVTVTFDQPLNTGAANQRALKVFGTQAGGLKTGTATVSGNTFTFAPSTSFKPGETVFTTVSPAVRGIEGQTLLNPKVFQFTAATAPATATFSSNQEPAAGLSPQAVVVGDVDGDGDLDMLAVNYIVNGRVSVRLNNGNGVFTTGRDVSVSYNPYHLALGDLDGDGDLDLVTANAGGPGGTVSVRINNGAGVFSEYSVGGEIGVGLSPHAVALGDVDGDGDLDLLAANYTVSGSTTNSNVSVRLNNGNGTFSSGSEVSVGTRPVSLTLGDVDNDGDLDFVTANSNTNTVSVRLNDGKGTFSGSTQVGVVYNPELVTLGDLDGDGDLDLATANTVSNAVSVRLNNGNGTFSGTQQVTTGLAPRGLVLGDVDGDGDLDLLTANSGNNTASVRLNNGAGSFSGNLEIAVGTSPSSLALGDLDGNGTLDFITANTGSNTASVRLNTPSASAIKVLAAAPAQLVEQVSLYPNPARTSVRLLLPAELGRQRLQVRVLNNMGQVVLTQTLAAQATLELALPQLAAGVYSLQLQTSQGLVTKRLLVE